MLLSPYLKRSLLNEIALKIKVKIFHVGSDFELRIVLLRSEILSHSQNLSRDFMRNDPLFSQHEDMSFIDIKNGLIRAGKI